jgi:photosystem II stability/assembly factor-like uncharacterized protein
VTFLLAFAVRGGSSQESPKPSPVRADVASTKKAAWTSLGLSGGGAMFTPAISPADPKRILLNCDMSGAYRSLDGGQSWELIHYQQLTSSTRVRPVWHPALADVAYAVGGGLLKITQDAGQTWNVVAGAPAGISAFALDPGHPESILVGVRRGIYRSPDAGKTWSEAAAVRGRVLGFHFDQTSPVAARTSFAATDQAVYRSDDGGSRWRELTTGFGSGPILAFAGGSNASSHSCALYCLIRAGDANAQTKGGIYMSMDRGATWNLATGAPTAERAKQGLARQIDFEFIVTSDPNPARVYATTRGGRGQVFRSDDAGATWREILFQAMNSTSFNVGPDYLIDERGRGGDTISGLDINPADPDNVIVADWMNCFITRDGGATWAVAHTRSAEDAGRRGKGMRWLNTGLVVTTVWNYYLHPFEPNRHFIAYTDIGFARSTDSGQTWYWHAGRPVRNTTYELAFDRDKPGLMWAAFADLHDIPQNNVISGRHYRARASGGVGVSTDFGATWVETSRGLAAKPITSVVVDHRSPKDSRTLYASAFEGGVFKSIDGGKNWAKASAGLGAPGVNERACRIILHSDGTLFCLVTALKRDGRFVAEGPGLYRSRNGGQSWEWINRSKPLNWPKDYDVDPRDSRVIYLGAADAGNSDGGLYKTTNGGDSWERVARKSRDCFGATVNPRRPDWVYLCIGEGDDGPGLWLSKDAGKTWRALEGLPFRNAQRVTFDPRDDSVIYVSTFGASVWRGPAE